MQYNPHKYQDYSKVFIETHPVSSLFLDCGLGKTVITLTALNDPFVIQYALSIQINKIANYS